MTVVAIGTQVGHSGKYVYVDYEPPQNIPVRRFAGYREISAWVLQEYGLEASSPQVSYVKRKHGISTRGMKRWPPPESVEITPEIESAIEAALWHFRMI